MQTLGQRIITIAAAGCANLLCRFLPFWLFPAGRKTPAYVRFLGKALPPAVFGMLVVYCLRDVELLSGTHGAPECIAILCTAALHLWKKQMILSIAGGTILYMFLVQCVF